MSGHETDVSQANERPRAADEKVRIPVRVPGDQYESLRQLAFKRRISLNQLALEGFAEVLRQAQK